MALTKNFTPDISLTSKDGPDYYSKLEGHQGLYLMLAKDPSENAFGASGHATYFDGIDCSRGSEDGSSGHCYFDATGESKR